MYFPHDLLYSSDTVCPLINCVPSLELFSYSERLYLSVRIVGHVCVSVLRSSLLIWKKHSVFHQHNVYHLAMRNDRYTNKSERWDKEIRVSISCFLLLLPCWFISISLRGFGDWFWFRFRFGRGLF